ncbi:MAG TPA: BON domain-containing protein [Xanthomonadaceae bacterium]|nr:BON domain-containing protein [Xanthomonadaceae bacterium]
MPARNQGGMGRQPRTPPSTSDDRSSGRGFDEHTADRSRHQRNTGSAYWDYDRQEAGFRGEDEALDDLSRGMNYTSDYQEDERRFERHSDLGVHGEGGDISRYGGTREPSGRRPSAGHESGRHGEPTGAPIHRGAARTSSYAGGHAQDDHLGPYQDSWSLGTGRGGRGLSDEDEGGRTHGRSTGGYSAMARSSYDAESRRGRGPRNYRRSDERIREDICERLMDDDYVDAGDIEVQVQDGAVTLTGTVGERWEKHRAEDIVDACGGVREIENRIRVSSARDAGGVQRDMAASSSSSATNAASGESTGSGMQTPADTRADRDEIGNSG